ncbi:MAG: hypothetical protein K2R98_10960 [Gemmataceae bacterium]|nr:hypothetical protein [Gemmataceae bacterium]
MSPFDQMLALLQRLDEAKISYRLQNSREGAVSVLAFAPGEYWEIDFLADDSMDIERFRSDGRIHDATMLEELFALWSEPESTDAVIENDAIARK